MTLSEKAATLATALDYSTAAAAEYALRHAITQDRDDLLNAIYCAGMQEAFKAALGLIAPSGDEGYDINNLLNGGCFSIVDALKEQGRVNAIGSAFL